MQIIYYLLFLISLIYGLYYIVTGIFSFKNMKKPLISSFKPNNKFAILVACRNEERVLKNLITSLKAQAYPKDLYEIIIIPNNCTDRTEEIAKECQTTILKFKEKTNCKGDVLKLAFKKLKNKKDIDAFIIFDADNVVHPHFLARMNDALNEGYKVAQGCRDSKNPADSWISGSYSIFYWLQNFFFNKARMQIKGSASINGTGFMIKKDIIKKYGFNVVTITEDIEFTAQCAINNIRIAYVEDAITYDEQPIKMTASIKQRKRWTTGTYHCLRKYNKQLLKSFIRNKNIASLDMFLNFLAPIFQILGFLLMTIPWILKIKKIDLTNISLSYGVIFMVITYFIGILINAFVSKYNKKDILNLLSGILLFALFMITWIPINIICLFKKTLSWEEIKHERDIKVGELIK